jgi:hypothetical protein
MAIALGGSDDSQGIAFIVAFGVVAEIVAMCCSSPQTAEINIRKRAETLMKWVHIGQGLSAALIVAAAMIDKKHRVAILAGGIAAMITVEALYAHARQAGLAQAGQAETEQY